MEYFSYRHPQSAFQIRVSRFAPPGHAAEFHFFIVPPQPSPFPDQFRELEEAYLYALKELNLAEQTAVFRRFFLSDCAGQAALLQKSTIARSESPVAISIVEGAPLPGLHVAMWAHHIQTAEPLQKKRQANTLAVERGAVTHLWTTGLIAPPPQAEPPDAATQTIASFETYVDQLKNYDATLRDEVVRTWVFVQDIDANYEGMVTARRELFARHGLTNGSHFFVSTGIAARHADPRCLILLDAYAVTGIDPSRIRFLTAPDHLGPTSAYGVTFERGVRLDYGDRAHVLLSGTASIDPVGKIVHPGDVLRQTERTCENIAALLADAKATTNDIAQMIVYIRNAADYQLVQNYLDKHLPKVPRIVVHAPVCRPGWLVEIECWAITPNQTPYWPPF